MAGEVSEAVRILITGVALCREIFLRLTIELYSMTDGMINSGQYNHDASESEKRGKGLTKSRKYRPKPRSKEKQDQIRTVLPEKRGGPNTVWLEEPRGGRHGGGTTSRP